MIRVDGVQHEPAGPLRRQCAWCGIPLDDVYRLGPIPDGYRNVTHGICPRCDEDVFGEHRWRQDWPVQPDGPQPGRRLRR